MSSAGLTIYLNDGGDVQIDDNFFNLALVGKYQVACSPKFGGPSGSLTVTGTMPIVAVASSGFSSLRSMSAGAGNTFTFNFLTVSALTLTVYVFDVPTNQGKFGLQTFNQAGVIAFDSSRSYMRILNDLQFSDYIPLLNNPVALPIGKSCAIMQSQFIGYMFARYFTPGESGASKFENEVNTFMYRVAGSVLYFGEFMTFRNETSLGIQTPWEWERKSGQLQIVDVTGY
ncbi:hypothetical protein [Pseudomonas protegens]|uniref:hypothetical protein n=1 Tax=Pseudomonas protegens TaxID=380021 RepID=UPI001072E960|nr:hypothetical protein [Pseudomonas protegens]